MWGPRFKLDQQLHEKVQRRATKLVPLIYNYSYKERLHMLDLPSLYYRRRRGDMITTYNILTNKVNIDYEQFFSIYDCTRGHYLKLFKPRSYLELRRQFFSVRVINDWNALPNEVINAPTVTRFKELLDRFCYSE